MKTPKTVVLVVAIATLTFSGCSKKSGEIDPTEKVENDAKDLVMTITKDGLQWLDGKTGAIKWNYNGPALIQSGKKFITQTDETSDRYTINNWSDSTELYKTAVSYQTIYTIDPSNGQKIKELKFKTLRPSFLLNIPGVTLGQWSSVLAANSSTAIMQMLQLLDGSANVILYAIDLNSGDILWSTPNYMVYRLDASITEDRLYIGGPYKSYELDVRTGKKLQDIGVSRLTTPPIGDKFYYYSVQNGNMYVLDAKTGSVKWQLPQAYSFLVSEGIVSYAKGRDVIAADQNTGAPIWTSRLVNDIIETSYTTYTLGVDKDILYSFVKIQDVITLFALDIHTGKELWQRRLPEFPSSDIFLSKSGVLYVKAKYATKISAIQISDGQKLWEYKNPVDSTAGLYGFKVYDNTQLDF